MNESSTGNQTSDESTEHELLADLADDFADRYRRGEHPSVEQYAQRHPHLAQQICELFPAMLLMEQQSRLDPTIASTPAVERVGASIGRYKLLERIGEGGFGVVFMAEQTHPVRRKVALKVIKAGMDSQQVIARFEAERQALAMMDHPNIAKVLDAGATDSGRPYFVMELVPGVPITEYCEKNQLRPRERLDLFVQVCQAVQHAHTKGIIHRDLKPTNVLVAVQDGRPVPKVIDFGVAKAAGQHLTDRTLFTQFAQMIGTPVYMSPEQAQLGGTDVDTRSDVYSLGVLLYELLTGTTPFERQRLRKAALDEVRRIIREEEPPRPSTRLSTAAAAVPSADPTRGQELRRLSGLVRGELDWIVMKALEKDRNRRYETANSLASDLLNYLHDEPVQACPPSARYRFGKFARRNRIAITTTTLVAAALLLGTIISTWQAFRAQKASKAEFEQRQAADLAKTVAEKQSQLAETNLKTAREAVNEYFTLTSESKLLDVPGMQPLRKELLEAALRYYQAMRGERADDPAVLADLIVAHLHVANIYHELDRNDDSLASIDLAVTLAQRLHDNYPKGIEQHCRLAGYWKAFRRVSKVTTMPKDPGAAHLTLTRFLRLWEVLVRENPSVEAFKNDVASIDYMIANLEGGRGQAGDRAGFTRAVVYARNAIAIWEELARAHPDVSRHQENLAMVYAELAWLSGRTGEPNQAREASTRAAALNEKLITHFPIVPTYRALAAGQRVGLALKLADSQPEKSEAEFRLALRDWHALVTDFPEAHEYAMGLAEAESQFAAALAGPLKRPDEAMEVFRVANERLTKQVAQYPDEPRYRRELALIPRRLAERLSGLKDRLSDAEKLHFQSLAVLDELIKQSPDDPDLWEMEGHTYRYLGWIARDTGRTEESLARLDKAASCFGKLSGADVNHKGDYYRSYLADTLLQKVHVLMGAGRAAEAEKSLRSAVDAYGASIRSRDQDAGTRWRRGDCYRSLGEWTKAEADYTRAIEINGTAWEAWSGRAFTFFEQQKWGQAISDFSKAIKLAPEVHTNWFHRGHAYIKLAQWDKAADDFTKVVEKWPTEPEGWYLRGIAHAQMGKSEEALSDLKQAVAKGLKDVGRMENDPNFQSLHGMEEFKNLLIEVERKKE
jgi:serine/threonine protein kinase/Flp pilus assembly protein TadD